MIEKIYETTNGNIHYWINEPCNQDFTLVFLPGLTADHRLFEKQIEYFEDKYNVFVWDAPGHGVSWPFKLDFTLMDKAKWLDEIFIKENIVNPVIIGQSMGGYVGQAYIEQFPGKLKGFISIDSAPLQRQYVTGFEIWLLKKMEPVYRYYPWKSLLKTGTNGCATSEYGRKLMYDIMMVYDNDKSRYAKLSGHGFKMLAEAMEADLPYKIECPALLICGEKDQAGSARRYNKMWSENTKIKIEWIKDAGHNSNTDKPEIVNSLIEGFVKKKLSTEV
jgi:pimeloyl-ACP methyl ester carboxylesterase